MARVQHGNRPERSSRSLPGSPKVKVPGKWAARVTKGFQNHHKKHPYTKWVTIARIRDQIKIVQHELDLLSYMAWAIIARTIDECKANCGHYLQLRWGRQPAAWHSRISILAARTISEVDRVIGAQIQCTSVYIYKYMQRDRYICTYICALDV